MQQQQVEVDGDGDSLSVMELLDMGTDTLMISTNSSQAISSSSSQASWALEGSWVRLVTSLAASTNEGVKAGAFGSLLGMQDSMTQTLDALTAALSSSGSGSSGGSSSMGSS